jgi:SAM-dependent methyltransferase
MNAYVLSHDLEGERQRLALMSELLDPTERRNIQQLGLRPGWRCLEVGSGNGSIAQWLASQVGASGHVVASDLDTSFIAELTAPNLEVRQLDIVRGTVEQNHYDLVVTRAVLHHLVNPKLVLERMLGALKPGGTLLVTEPDMLPATVAEPGVIRKFWHGWFRWAASAGIDYFIGSKIPAILDELGLEQISATGETALFNGGSAWATYLVETIRELRPKLAELGHVSDEIMNELEPHFQDSHYWTSAINFVATSARKPAR